MGFILGLVCGFGICTMIFATTRATLEDKISQYEKRDNILLEYIQTMRTGDFEITKEKVLETIERELKEK